MENVKIHYDKLEIGNVYVICQKMGTLKRIINLYDAPCYLGREIVGYLVPNVPFLVLDKSFIANDTCANQILLTEENSQSEMGWVHPVDLLYENFHIEIANLDNTKEYGSNMKMDFEKRFALQKKTDELFR